MQEMLRKLLVAIMSTIKDLQLIRSALNAVVCGHVKTSNPVITVNALRGDTCRVETLLSILWKMRKEGL